MKGLLIVGIGGFGRGVANWVKRNLAERFGSPGKGGATIRVADGPAEDQYELPGGGQIDVTDGSEEFVRLDTTPSGVIGTISEGGKVPFISKWLSQQDARRIPNRSSMNPRAGGGGSRATGRATFFLHVGRILAALRHGLRKAISYLPGAADDTDDSPGGGQAVVVVNMSTSGAMGAGMGLDVAHLLKSIKDEGAMLIGVVALANSYDFVIADPAGRTKRDAKSVALLRELVRFQHGEDFPARIQYTHDIGVQSVQLFDLCIIIDGEGTDLSLNDVHPVYGVCAAAADLQMALALDERHIATELPNWVSSVIGNAGEGRRFMTFGIHSHIFPRADLMDTFSLRFARDLYSKLITPPEGAEEEGRQLADTLLNKGSFTGMALKLQKSEELPVTPPENEKKRHHLTGLIDSFTVASSESIRFPLATPDERVLQFHKKVKTRRFWFFRVHNQEVILGCKAVSESYTGATHEKPRSNTVRGWLKGQAEHVEEEFAKELVRSLRAIFYHPRTDKPVMLNDKPYVLTIGRDYLLHLREVMGPLESAFRAAYTRWVDDEGVLEKQRTKVAELEKGLSQGGKDRPLQNEFIREYQRWVELEIWAILTKACADLTGRLRAIIERWWIQIGHPTESWHSLIQDTVAHLDARLSSVLSDRTDLARVKTRRYFPFPDDPAEKAMYADFVKEKEYHTNLLSQMSFAFYSENRKKLDETSQQNGVYELYLNAPEVEGYDASVDEHGVYDAVTGRYKNLRVKGHSASKIVQYGRNCLEPVLRDIGLSKAMWYDHTYRWRPLRQDDECGMEEYVVEMASALSEKSHVFLSQRPTGRGEARDPVTRDFCLGHFTDLPNAESNSAEELATMLKKQMDGRTGTHEVEAMDDIVTCLRFQLGVDINNWSYFSRCLSNYDQYLEDPESEPVQVYPEERNALELELVLRDDRLRDDGYLPASTVKYLGDMEAFTSFSISYALGLLAVEEGRMDTKDAYMVNVETPGSGQDEVILGPCDDLHSVVAECLAPKRADVRAAITEKLAAHLTNREGQVGIEGIIAELRSAAVGVYPTAEIDADQHDLHLAIMAAIYRFIRTVDGNQRRSDPRALPGQRMNG